MTTGATGSGEFRDVVFPGGRVVAVGAATTVVAIACGIFLQAWAQGPHPRHDMFEPFIEPWAGLTWISVLALWISSFTRRWPWLPLAALGLCCIGIQVWMGMGSMWIGVRDDQVGGAGALAGALSTAQIGLALAWMALIALSKRMPS